VIHIALRFVEANFGRLIVNFQLVPIVVPLWFQYREDETGRNVELYLAESADSVG
jgi:hypothetical protein